MAEVKGARFNKEQERALEALVEEGKADNESEAHRMLVNAGMHAYGLSVSKRTPRLAQIANKVAWGFGIIGVTWAFTTMTYPVSLRLPALFALFACFGAWATGWVITEYSGTVERLLGGETHDA